MPLPCFLLLAMRVARRHDIRAGHSDVLYRYFEGKNENGSCLDTHTSSCLNSRKAEELTALKAELEPALAAAESEAAVATAEAKREQSGRAQAEFRAGTMAESLNLELEGERRKAKGLKEKMRLLERVRCAG